MTPWPAVVPLPYSLVWFESAVAHVHCFVSLLGLTPGLVVVFVVPEQLSNFDPPRVILVCESADGLLVEVAALSCAVADAFALGPAAELLPLPLVEACAA